MITWERHINIFAVVIIVGVLTSAFGVQFILHEEPCPLCLLQRLGMLGVITSLLLNVRFGIQSSHYGLALLSCLSVGQWLYGKLPYTYVLVTWHLGHQFLD